MAENLCASKGTRPSKLQACAISPAVGTKRSVKIDVQSIDGNANRFTFDRVIRPSARQVEVYDYGDRFGPGVCMGRSQQHALPTGAKAVIEDVLKGYNGTIFAYGQTSSALSERRE